jgi:hypothetical protein
MTATLEERPDPPGAGRRAAAGGGPARAGLAPGARGTALVLGCLALAALTLLGPDQPTYDPTAWLIWGREIVHGDLVTTTGPSWKPLPVLFTVPFALAGDAAAPLLWLIVARAGGLLALAAGYRLAARVAGRPAGVVAVVALALSEPLAYNAVRGDSEGLLVALVLWAIDRGIDGHRRQAFALGALAALLRPEVWPFIALYGGWLVLSAGGGPRARSRVALAVAASGVTVGALWLVPEQIGSGELLRAASRAREPVEGSPAESAHPFLAVFTNSAKALPWPVYAGGVLAVLVAAVAWRRRRGGGAALALAAAATVLMVIVAALAQGGFTGNLRYVTLPASMVCVLAGIGWAWAAGDARARLGGARAVALLVVVAAACAPSLVSSARLLSHQATKARKESRLYAALPAAITAAGGRDAVVRCGPVFTGPYETQALAWALRLHERQVSITPRPPGTSFAPWYSPFADDVGFAHVRPAGRWVVRSSCPLGR